MASCRAKAWPPQAARYDITCAICTIACCTAALRASLQMPMIVEWQSLPCGQSSTSRGSFDARYTLLIRKIHIFSIILFTEVGSALLHIGLSCQSRRTSRLFPPKAAKSMDMHAREFLRAQDALIISLLSRESRQGRGYS